MEDKKKGLLLEKHIKNFRYRVDYKVGGINESPTYRSLVSDDEEFDNLPTEIYNTEDGQPVSQGPSFTSEAGDQEDAPKPEGEVPPAPSNDQPVGMDGPDSPENDMGGNTDMPLDGGDEVPAPDMGGEGMPPDMGDGMQSPENVGMEVDVIQNDIIKHNIAAMQSIQSNLENLSNIVTGLNSKLDVLHGDVEEVREPSNTEKLMNKTNVSYPYYFNLNDFWSDNWFDKKNGDMSNEKPNEQGMRELPDGTYIADFDDLPKPSKSDIADSFNK